MFAALVSGGVVTDAIVCDAAPDGWIASETRIGVGWTFDGSTFAAPPATSPPTEAEVVAEIADSFINGGDRDKAIAMVIADVVAKAFNIPTADARTMVRDRLISHLETLRGI